METRSDSSQKVRESLASRVRLDIIERSLLSHWFVVPTLSLVRGPYSLTGPWSLLSHWSVVPTLSPVHGPYSFTGPWSLLSHWSVWVPYYSECVYLDIVKAYNVRVCGWPRFARSLGKLYNTIFKLDLFFYSWPLPSHTRTLRPLVCLAYLVLVYSFVFHECTINFFAWHTFDFGALVTWLRLLLLLMLRLSFSG